METPEEWLLRHTADAHSNDEAVMMALFGPWKDSVFGALRDESQGLVRQVDRLRSDVEGMKQDAGKAPRSRLAPADRVLVWAAALSVIVDQVASKILNI